MFTENMNKEELIEFNADLGKPIRPNRPGERPVSRRPAEEKSTNVNSLMAAFKMAR